MKKLLLISMLCLIASLTAKMTEMDMPTDKIATIINGLKGLTITEPKDLAQEWLHLKAEKLELGAKEAQAMADQFKGEDKAKWENIIELKEELAKALRAAPVKDFKKSMKHLPDWMRLKAKCFMLKAKQFVVLAKEVSNPELKAMLVKKAEHFKWHGEQISEALKS